ncbi:MAG: choice-of-anchor X domain-containing protein, partial [Candidatus Hermodarchaeota archaeon]
MVFTLFSLLTVSMVAGFSFLSYSSVFTTVPDAPSFEFEGLHISQAYEDWYRIWEGNGTLSDIFDILVDSSGNIYATGRSGIPGDSFSYNITLFKFDPNGNLLWERDWRGGSLHSIGNGLANDSLGNIYVSGSDANYMGSVSYLCLLKYSPTGNLLWDMRWGKAGDFSGGYDVTVDSDGNAYVTGRVGATNGQMVLAKFNSTGHYQWNITWGTWDSESGQGIAMDKTTGNFYITGIDSNYTNTVYDVFLNCFNSTGDLEWSTVWDSGEEDIANDIALNSNGDIFVSGYSEINGVGNQDLLLIKFNSMGVAQWNKTWSGVSDLEESTGLAIDSSDNVYMTGRIDLGSGDNVALIKVNSTDEVEYVTEWNLSGDQFGLCVDVDSSDNLYIGGNTEATTYTDNLLVKFSAISDMAGPVITNVAASDDPLPVGAVQTITCDVSDATGITSVTAYLDKEIVIATIPLYDDGAHGDGAAGDGTYGNTWDSTGAEDGLYRIDIQAIDNSTFQNVGFLNNGGNFTIISPPSITITLPAGGSSHGA